MFPPKDCSGCGACVNSCPVQAILFQKDHENFYYPSVNMDACVHCGLCEKICPVLNLKFQKCTHPKAYASQCLRDEIRASSSSGGIFSVLSERVISMGGIVVGCAMTPDCYSAEHKFVCDTRELTELRGSKYLQSRVDLMYPQVKKMLENGKYVLFSGTPCQVVGLRAYLSGMCAERLITVDVICHGAPSPLVWEKYVKYWEEVKQSKAVSVCFRDKEQDWEEYSLVLRFENGEEYRSLCAKDLYCKGFVSDYFLRRSCYSCHAKGEHHVSDITLGDFWGIDRICSDMNDRKGTSLVLLNTSKGEALFQSVQPKTVWRSVDFHEAIRHNPSYSYSSNKLAYRNHFMRRVHNKPIVKHLTAYCSPKLIYRVKRKIIGIAGTVFAR